MLYERVGIFLISCWISPPLVLPLENTLPLTPLLSGQEQLNTPLTSWAAELCLGLTRGRNSHTHHMCSRLRVWSRLCGVCYALEPIMLADLQRCLVDQE
jgi:hypothetical protein